MMRVSEIIALINICEHHLATLDYQINDEEEQRNYYSGKMSDDRNTPNKEQTYYAESVHMITERIRALKSEKDAALICIGKLKNLEVSL